MYPYLCYRSLRGEVKKKTGRPEKLVPKWARINTFADDGSVSKKDHNTPQTKNSSRTRGRSKNQT